MNGSFSVRRMERFPITKSARYAERLVGDMGLDLFERHGKPVEEIKINTLDHAADVIFENLKIQKDQYETAAVLTMTEKEAKQIYGILEKRLDDVDPNRKITYMDRESSSFQKGITVTTFYLAKGLEFDQVFTIYGEKKEEPLMKQARYICATRALHELYMLEILIS